MDPLREPGDVTRLEFVRATWRTVRADRHTYRSHNRPMTLHRLVRSVRPRADDPVFVIGAPRSGTTFVGTILAAIPELSYHFEPVATKALARSVGTAWSEDASATAFRLVYRLLLGMHLDGDLRFSEKTPQLSFLTEFLADRFPGAQFVHVIRDGRDAACSYRDKGWLSAAAAGSGRREPGGYLHGPFPRFWVEPERREEFARTSDLHRCIWAWRRFTEAALRTASFGQDRYLEIRYEDLVTSPISTTSTILDHLGLDSEDSRARALNAAREADPGSVGRWRRECTGTEIKTMSAEAGDLLAVLGYAPPARLSPRGSVS